MIALLALVLASIALYLVLRLQRQVEALERRPATPYQPPPGVRPAAPPPPPFPSSAPSVPSSPPSSPVTPIPATVDPPPLPVAGVEGAAVAAASTGDEVATIERRIGERLLLYAGMLVLLLGVAFFLRYSFERNWMSPVVRVALGVVGGSGLLAAGRVFARRGFRAYGLFLSGGGFVALFLSIYAAFAFYGLIGQLPAFVMLAVMAAGAAVLADREEAFALAFLAVCGGFATPFLVGGESDAQVALFSYDALLIAATMYLAHRRQWPWLNLASFLFTVVTVVAWIGAHYDDRGLQYLRTELFLTLYCAMFVAILRQNRRLSHPHAPLVSVVLWGAPVLYHVASIGLLLTHPVAFLVYLLLVSVAFVVGAAEIGSSAMRLTGWVAVVLPLLAWIEGRFEPDLTTATVVTAFGTWLIFLLASLHVVRQDGSLRGADVALVHAAGLGVFAALYLTLDESQSSGSLAGIGLLLALANAGLWTWLRPAGPVSLHWLGLAGVLVVVATAVGLRGEWIVAMWAAEAVALVWIGLRTGREWFRIAGLAVFGLSAWLWLQAAPPESVATVFLHARALAGACLIAALYLAGWLLRTAADSHAPTERAVVLVAASVVTVVLVSLEIDGYWVARGGRGGDAELSRQLMFSAWWAAYAGLLTAIGMRYRYAPIRYFAILLFVLTILKVFLVDIQRLAGIYRVVALLVVGAILLLVSFLYQRSRAETSARESPTQS